MVAYISTRQACSVVVFYGSSGLLQLKERGGRGGCAGSRKSRGRCHECQKHSMQKLSGVFSHNEKGRLCKDACKVHSVLVVLFVRCFVVVVPVVVLFPHSPLEWKQVYFCWRFFSQNCRPAMFSVPCCSLHLSQASVWCPF